MDQQTLEYLINNTKGLAINAFTGFLVGTLVKPMQDMPQASKLGYAAFANFGVDAIGLVQSKNILDVSKDDVGNILGWYIGFNLGTLTIKGIKKTVEKYMDKKFN